MLNTKSVKVKINNKTKSHYLNLGYDLDNGFFDVSVEDLPKASRVFIDVDCDYCDSNKVIAYCEYFRNVSHNGKFACSNVCGSMKKKELSIIKHGVDSPSKLDSIKQKNKKTNFEKYGVDYYMKTDEFREKSKKTCLEKYGFTHAMKSNIVQENLKQSIIEKYGVENVFQSDSIKKVIKEIFMYRYGVDHPMKFTDIKEKSKQTKIDRYGVGYTHIHDKIKQTCLKKYGVDSYMKTIEFKIQSKDRIIEKYGVEFVSQSEEIKDKIKQTCLKKYGVDSYMKTPDFKISSKDTIIEKYGVEFVSQSENIRKLNFNNCQTDNYINYDRSVKESIYLCGKGHTFSIKSSNYISRSSSDLSLCTVCNPINGIYSIRENELLEYISSIYDGEIIQSYSDGLEIDIYLPGLNIGFEFNGLYWHSEKYKDKNYHLNKTKYFDDRGIRIIHIWEDNWVNNRIIIESQINNIVGKTKNKIYARKCEIVYIDNCTEFMNTNHIQGMDRSNIKVGLIYLGEIVSIMTFNKLEGRKKLPGSEWNLSRFCNKINISVVGGASKLLTNFIKDNNVTRIISYSDNDWSVGNLYKKLGFETINKSNPDYKYVVGGVRRNKQNYKKSNMGIHNQKITEREHMSGLGYYRIWDCGKTKHEMFVKLK